MHDILQILSNYKIDTGGISGLLLLVLYVGRKVALKMALGILDEIKDGAIKNIEGHSHIYAVDIYRKIPKKLRMFISIKTIEKNILKLAQKIETLDKK